MRGSRLFFKKGEVSTHAGNGKCGHQDGDRMNAMFNNPCGLAVNQETGDIYVADWGNHVIRKINYQGMFLVFSCYFFEDEIN